MRRRRSPGFSRSRLREVFCRMWLARENAELRILFHCFPKGNLALISIKNYAAANIQRLPSDVGRGI
jgi:hypothetical protein